MGEGGRIPIFQIEEEEIPRWEKVGGIPIFKSRVGGREGRRDELTGGTAAAAGGSGAAGETKTSTEAAVFVRRSTDNTGWG